MLRKPHPDWHCSYKYTPDPGEGLIMTRTNRIPYPYA